MRLPLECFAREFLRRDAAGRTTWINTRANGLYRLVQDVKDAATRVMDQGIPIGELENAIACLQRRLQCIRDHAAAVGELRESEQAGVSTELQQAPASAPTLSYIPSRRTGTFFRAAIPRRT